MARTIAEIKAELVAAKAAESALDGVDSTSKVAEWNLWLDVVSFCVYTLESLFDLFKLDVDATLAKQKPHTLQWYVTKAKAFQYGETLPADTDVYEVVPPVDDSVLIVSSAAAEEIYSLNIVRVKVAKGLPGALTPLSGPQLTALRAYMKRIKDAGVRVQVTTGNADDLKLELEVYYDALVLDSDGVRLDGSAATPVKDAIDAYLSALDFNGVFVLNDMIDAIEAVGGVKIAHVVSASANYGALPYVAIPVTYRPDAGYLKLNDTFFDANVTYIAG